MVNGNYFEYKDDEAIINRVEEYEKGFIVESKTRDE